MLKQEDDDRTDSGSQERYESFSYGGVDPYMWEPQEVGKRARKQHSAGRTFDLNWESATVLLKWLGIVSVLHWIREQGAVVCILTLSSLYALGRVWRKHA